MKCVTLNCTQQSHTFRRLSDVSAHGTVLLDCVVEGSWLIFTPVGVEDDEEPKDRASETHDDEGACRAGR